MNSFKVIFAVTILLMGCAGSPKEIQVSSSQQLVGFDKVSSGSVGRDVRWGGVITSLIELDSVANVTIRQFPLLNSGQPTYKLGSGGTFTARFKSFDGVKQGDVITLLGKVEGVQNPHPDLKSTQLVIIETNSYYVWEGFSRASNPIVENDHPAFIERGKWGWDVKSQKDKDRERQEEANRRMDRNLRGGVGKR